MDSFYSRWNKHELTSFRRLMDLGLYRLTHQPIAVKEEGLQLVSYNPFLIRGAEGGDSNPPKHIHCGIHLIFKTLS